MSVHTFDEFNKISAYNKIWAKEIEIEKLPAEIRESL